MSFDDRRVRDWLGHIVDNCDRVASHMGDLSFDAFSANLLVRDAVERCIERITEAAVRIGPGRLSEIAPDVPLSHVRGLGNVLRHEYDRVNPQTIWETATGDLPALRTACAAALSGELD